MTTKAKASAFRFLPTKLAVAGAAVAGFLGLWGWIGASASSQSTVTDNAVEGPESAGVESPQVVIVERQVTYVMPGQQPRTSAAQSAPPPASGPQPRVSAPAPTAPKPAPRAAAKTSRAS